MGKRRKLRCAVCNEKITRKQVYVVADGLHYHSGCYSLEKQAVQLLYKSKWVAPWHVPTDRQ